MALAADITLDARQSLLNLLTQALQTAVQKSEIDLGPLQAPPAQLAGLIVATMDGIKHASEKEARFEDSMNIFIRLLRTATAPNLASKRAS